MKKSEGKVAIVTGGSRGIGAGIARRLGAEGARVVITYAHTADKAKAVVAEIQQAGGEAMAIRADNKDAAEVKAAIEKVVNTYGAIDILVLNAGVAMLKPVGELTTEDYDVTMAVNARAVFIASHAALPHMNDNGRIIIIGSNMADRVAMQAGSLYAMSKSALIGLTKGLARELGSRGITVNLVQPGPIDTDMNPATGEHADAARRMMAIPRYGRPEEIAGLVAYLASEESAFMTGASLTMDGGYNI
jgi:Dehydrogenases with different specificities (related to short-chain alcohol dehydrogenases)